MTLKECTKDELLFIIGRLTFGSEMDWHLQRALNDVSYQREQKKLAEAERLRKLSYDKRVEYIDLLTPYKGKRILDIPLSVVEKADAAMKEADEADQKWAKLMNIKMDKPRRQKRD